MQFSNTTDAVWLILGPLCLAIFLGWADRGLVGLRGRAARNERRRTTAMFLNSLSIAFVIAGLANRFFGQRLLCSHRASDRHRLGPCRSNLGGRSDRHCAPRSGA